MDKCPILEWPSRRIPPGGVFHCPKIKYSQETHDLLRTIMNESKLTLYQQKQVDWCLRSGTSLVDAKCDLKQERICSASSAYTKRPAKISRRRSLSAIQISGDFEREKFRSIKRNEDREAIKSHLQEIMEFGKKQEHRSHASQAKLSFLKKHQEKHIPGQSEVLQDLLSQIKERADWLEEMEALGEGAKHREVIHHQIAERIRKIEKLDLPNKLSNLNIEDNAESSNEVHQDLHLEGTKQNVHILQRTVKKRDSKKKYEENIADIISCI